MTKKRSKKKRKVVPVLIKRQKVEKVGTPPLYDTIFGRSEDKKWKKLFWYSIHHIRSLNSYLCMSLGVMSTKSIKSCMQQVRKHTPIHLALIPELCKANSINARRRRWSTHPSNCQSNSATHPTRLLHPWALHLQRNSCLHDPGRVLGRF